ncbi:MAG: protein translocase subunit SecD, partial [Burkholderiaceae bacterium]
MNRYALWKYIVIVIALILGALYTLPNFYGESPAVQVSSGRQTIKIDPALMSRVETILEEAKLPHEGVYFETIGTNASVRARFADTDTQLKARDLLQRALVPNAEDPDYIVALNL